MTVSDDGRIWAGIRAHLDAVGELAPSPRLDDVIRVRVPSRGGGLRLASALLVTAVAVGGAALLALREIPQFRGGAGDAPVACVTMALEDHGSVTAFFASTVGAIRAVPAARNDEQLATYPSDGAASICYIDGQIPKGPPIPPDPSATVPPSFDRAVLVVIGQDTFMVAAGYRQNLPIKAP